MNAKSPTQTSASSRLSREDWINAAHNAVVEGGFSAVRVLTLAEAIGVTRGSFYWHFGSQSELVEALINRWCAAEAERMRQFESDRPSDPQAAMGSWLEAVIHSAPGSDYPHRRFGLALRAYAGQNSSVAQRLAEVDRQRFAMLNKVFLSLTPDTARAREYALTCYLAMGGLALALSNSAFDKSLSQEMSRAIVATTLRPLTASI